MDAPDRTPLVSIILPSYNSAQNLAEAIGSILCQRYSHFELIIIDDGSTDTTESVLASFSDPRITIIRHPENYGVARAYNSGLRASRGKYIGFIGSDDTWEPEKLEEEIACFSHLPEEYGLVYSDMWDLDPAGNRHYWHSPDIPGQEIINPTSNDYQVYCLGNGTALIRRDILDRAGVFDEQFRCFVDLDFLIRLSRICRFYHIRKPLYSYRSGRGTSSNPVEVSRSRILLLKKYPETMKDRHFLLHQYDLICHNLHTIGDEKRRLQEEVKRTTGQNDLLCSSLRTLEEENTKLRQDIRDMEHYLKERKESLAENFPRFFDEVIISNLCPTGSRRERLYHHGLDAFRRLVNPLLRYGKK